MYSIYCYDLHSFAGQWNLIYSPDRVEDGYVVTSASFTIEIDKAGDASFTIPYNHPQYNNFHKIQTMIVIKDDDKIVWFGRVFGIKRDWYNNKIITCEGALTFLNDICLMPYRYYKAAGNENYEEEVGTTTSHLWKTSYDIEPVTKGAHLDYVLRLYNYRCSDKRKVDVQAFGEVYASDMDISGCETYNTVLQEIQDKVIGDYDYSILTTYSLDDEGNVLPVFQIGRMPFSTCNQTIEFGKNLLSFEDYISADDLYSSMIPVGDGNISIFNDNNQDDMYSTVPIFDRNYFITTGLESPCGVIDKVVNLNGIDDRAILRTTGEKLLELGGGVTEPEFTISAVDLHLLDVYYQQIEVGAKIKVISQPHGINSDFACLKTEINMLKPDQNKYTFSVANKKANDKLTGKIQNDADSNRQEMNQKLNVNQQYGVVRISHDDIALVMPGGNHTHVSGQ